MTYKYWLAKNKRQDSREAFTEFQMLRKDLQAMPEKMREQNIDALYKFRFTQIGNVWNVRGVSR